MTKNASDDAPLRGYLLLGVKAGDAGRRGVRRRDVVKQIDKFAPKRLRDL